MDSAHHAYQCFSVRDPPALVGEVAILAETCDGAKAWFDGEYDGTWRAARLPAHRTFYVRGWRVPYGPDGDIDSRTLTEPLQPGRNPRLYPSS